MRECRSCGSRGVRVKKDQSNGYYLCEDVNACIRAYQDAGAPVCTGRPCTCITAKQSAARRPVFTRSSRNPNQL